MNSIMLAVISPRGIVKVPSTSKRARMRGFFGDVVSDIVGKYKLRIDVFKRLGAGRVVL